MPGAVNVMATYTATAPEISFPPSHQEIVAEVDFKEKHLDLLLDPVGACIYMLTILPVSVREKKNTTLWLFPATKSEDK